MTWTEVLRHVQEADQCDETEARRQIANAIADGVLFVRWADERYIWGVSGPMQPPPDEPPKNALYWRECTIDSTDPDRVLEPRPYDPDLVDKETAERFDRTRRFRKPMFWRDHVLLLWPPPRGSTTTADEKRAVSLLRDCLKANNKLTRADAWAICRKQFPKLSERGFKFRVWPDARVAAGLERTARPGRKSRPQRA